MKLRGFILLAALLALLAAGCTTKTTLTFTNSAECGTVTITITNNNTGSMREYQVDEGKETAIDIQPGVTYRYEVRYAGRPGMDMECESKSAQVMMPNRGTMSINLQSATPTPRPD